MSLPKRNPIRTVSEINRTIFTDRNPPKILEELVRIQAKQAEILSAEAEAMHMTSLPETAPTPDLSRVHLETLRTREAFLLKALNEIGRLEWHENDFPDWIKNDDLAVIPRYVSPLVKRGDYADAVIPVGPGAGDPVCNPHIPTLVSLQEVVETERRYLATEGLSDEDLFQSMILISANTAAMITHEGATGVYCRSSIHGSPRNGTSNKSFTLARPFLSLYNHSADIVLNLLMMPIWPSCDIREIRKLKGVFVARAYLSMVNRNEEDGSLHYDVVPLDELYALTSFTEQEHLENTTILSSEEHLVAFTNAPLIGYKDCRETGARALRIPRTEIRNNQVLPLDTTLSPAGYFRSL